MGILTRFKDIMSANVNALLDKAEDPAKMIDQTLLNLRKDLAEVKKETAAVMADEKNAKRKVTECEEQIADYKAAAESALRAGNEDDARTLLEAKKKEEEKLAALQKTYDMTAANADNMHAMHDKLVIIINTICVKLVFYVFPIFGIGCINKDSFHVWFSFQIYFKTSSGSL